MKLFGKNYEIDDEITFMCRRRELKDALTTLRDADVISGTITSHIDRRIAKECEKAQEYFNQNADVNEVDMYKVGMILGKMELQCDELIVDNERYTLPINKMNLVNIINRHGVDSLMSSLDEWQPMNDDDIEMMSNQDFSEYLMSRFYNIVHDTTSNTLKIRNSYGIGYTVIYNIVRDDINYSIWHNGSLSYKYDWCYFDGVVNTVSTGRRRKFVEVLQSHFDMLEEKENTSDDVVVQNVKNSFSKLDELVEYIKDIMKQTEFNFEKRCKHSHGTKVDFLSNELILTFDINWSDNDNTFIFDKKGYAVQQVVNTRDKAYSVRINNSIFVLLNKVNDYARELVRDNG